MTLLEMRTMLRRRVGNPTTAQVADASLNTFLNLAMREIQNKYRFAQGRSLYSFNTVNGTRSYALPANAASIMYVRDATSEDKLQKLDDEEIARLTEVTTTGTPVFYYRDGNNLLLHPTPDGVYAMVAKLKVAITELSADGDTPAIPASWHYGIVLLARHYYWDDQGDDPKAISAKNFYKDWASDQPVEVDEEKSDLDRGVSVPTLSQNVRPTQDFAHSD